MVKTASAGGCPFACGGGIPVKPFTLMGEGMLVTVGALMPGGVLPPAATGQTCKDREKHSAVGFFFPFPQDIMEKFCFDWPPSISWKCQRGRSSGPVKTLNVRADFLSQCGPRCDTTAIRSESEDILYKSTENRVRSVLWVAITYLPQMIACNATMLNVHFHHFKASRQYRFYVKVLQSFVPY